ncbi:MAG: M48 family metallopeptidase [Hyphomicrobiales bacterium]|nr:M48 family metallopeptidase [Hyphomicrobiales bacterium]
MTGAPAPLSIYFDGRDNRPHRVSLDVGTELEIRDGSQVLARWSPAQTQRLTSADGMARFAPADRLNLARLEVTDEALIRSIEAAYPQLSRARAARLSHRQKLHVGALGAAALASMATLFIYGLPWIAGVLAPRVPLAFQQAIGDASARQIREIYKAKTCASAPGQVALDHLLAELARAGRLKIPLHPLVLRTKIANAMALPGGTIFVFSPLLQDARTPDELAGVIAHELGHEAHYDSMRRLIENGGVGFLLGLMFGDISGSTIMVGTARALVGAAYSRSIEKAADDFSIRVMTRLGRSPKALGVLLQRISKGHDVPAALSLLADHPLTADRLADIDAHNSPVTGPPLVNETQWMALKSICGR